MKTTRPFITGTGAYGPFTKYSDIDLVMIEEDVRDLLKTLEYLNIKISQTGEYDLPSLKFDFFGRFINIIQVKDQDEYDSWLSTTGMFQNCLIAAHDKKARIENFQGYRDSELKAIKASNKAARPGKLKRLWRWLRKPIYMGRGITNV